jgi:hypothetical protein
MWLLETKEVVADLGSPEPKIQGQTGRSPAKTLTMLCYANI